MSCYICEEKEKKKQKNKILFELLISNTILALCFGAGIYWLYSLTFNNTASMIAGFIGSYLGGILVFPRKLLKDDGESI